MNVVFLIGVYYGDVKPPLELYLKDLVSELLSLNSHGFVAHDIVYFVRVHCCPLDSPARSFIKGTKLCSGYEGCDRCIQTGLWYGRVVYLDNYAQVRTDLSFRKQSHKEHHKAISPFEQLEYVDMVSSFPLDYQHVVCLGGMRKMLAALVNGKTGFAHLRMSAQMTSSVSNLIISCAGFMPCDFNRKGRSLLELDFWKATEFRTFLLYTGIVCLKGIVHDEFYHNFLHFSFAIRILCTPQCETDAHMLYIAETLIHSFVNGIQGLYGREFMVYQIHALVHLVSDVKKYGCLDNFSCFPFENFLGQLKSVLRTGNKPLSQVLRRVSERGVFFRKLNKDQFEASSSPVFLSNCVRAEYVVVEGVNIVDCHTLFYSQIRFSGFVLKLKSSDCFFSSLCYKTKIFKAKYFLKIIDCNIVRKVVVCESMNIVRPFIENLEIENDMSVNSGSWNIYVLSVTDYNLFVIDAESVNQKLLILPYKNLLISMPILHCS